MILNRLRLAIVLGLGLIPCWAQAQFVAYSNTNSFQGNNVFASSIVSNPATLAAHPITEIGDEVILTGTSRTVVQFSFEYFGDFALVNGQQGQIRFYKNDGPGAVNFKSPGTVLFDSGRFNLQRGQHNVNLGNAFAPLNVTVPTTFTWTFQTYGTSQTSGDQVGLALYNPPTKGTSFNDFWFRQDGVFYFGALSGGMVANFGAVVITVPEPGMAAMGLVGAGVLFAARRFKR